MTKLYFRSLDAASKSLEVLDLVPDTHAWLKDRAGRFVFGNRLFLERFGFNSTKSLTGKCDYDLAPAYLADQYTEDDAAVLEGSEVLDRLELIVGKQGAGDWFLTSKWPVFDNRKKVMGSLGLSRHLNRTAGTATPFRELRAPVDYIHRHFASPISVESLASACNLSVSALERRFRKHLGKTPRQYINEVRLDHVRQLLRETGKPIGTIAQETGFADHSHLSRAYRKQFGISPREDRN